MKKHPFLETTDPELYTAVCAEEDRQHCTLNLIASENYTHPAVLEAVGSKLTAKYAEGYPGKRYYAGCRHVDIIETLALTRCKKLFGIEHANVQPHSGTSANFSVLSAVLKPGDTLLGMSLAAGGHLTHGHSVNVSGSLYHALQYSVTKDTETIDYAQIALLAEQYKPKIIIAGASAYSRIIDWQKISQIAQAIGAIFMADIAHIAGLIIAGLHPTPVGYADIITSTTHKTLRGPRGGIIMCTKQYASQIDRSVMPGTQGGPAMHTIAGKAVCFKLAALPDFTTYQQQVVSNAHALAQQLQSAGYRIVSGGTDTHLFIVDLSNKNITGRQAEQALESAGITASRSTTPFDSQPPWITSGVRFGTPALTTLGATEQDMPTVAEFIHEAFRAHSDTKKLEAIQQEVARFMSSLEA